MHAAEQFFARHDTRFSWVPPQAETVCFPRVLETAPVHGAIQDTAAGGEAFCARLLERSGALLLPSTVYNYDDSHLRLGLGRDGFQAGLEALDAFLVGR